MKSGCQSFINYADEDLAVASILFLNMSDEYSFMNQAAFFSAQAGEKYLKGYLVGKWRVDGLIDELQIVSKLKKLGHDLEKILSICMNENDNFKKIIEETKRLNVLAELKYPDVEEDFLFSEEGLSIKSSLARDADNIGNFVKTKIKELKVTKESEEKTKETEERQEEELSGLTSEENKEEFTKKVGEEKEESLENQEEQEKSEEENNKANFDFAFEIMSKKLNMQNHAFTSLESKIGILFGFVGIITGSAIVLIQNKTELVGLNLFTFGLGVLYISLFLLAMASKTRTFLDPPDFPVFYSEEAFGKKNIDLKNQVVADMKESFQVNNNNQSHKSRLYNHALWLFIVSILILFLGILG